MIFLKKKFTFKELNLKLIEKDKEFDFIVENIWVVGLKYIIFSVILEGRSDPKAHVLQIILRIFGRSSCAKSKSFNFPMVT